MAITTQSFVDYKQKLERTLPADAVQASQRLMAALPDWRTPAKYADLGANFIQLSNAYAAHYDSTTFSTLNRLLVAKLAARLPETIQMRNLTEEIISLYPAALERLFLFLAQSNDEDYYYPHEYFLKDVRFAAGLTVPGGAKVLDLRNRIGWKPGIRMLARNGLRDTLRFLPYFQKSPWFAMHMEMRYLDEFNAAGMEQFYMRVAGLLEKQPEVHGMLGLSWFYDSKLASVSPRLGFIHKQLAEGGALILRGPATAYSIESALKKSPTRRRLYAEGRYTPVGCLVIWPRDQMLAWAHRKKGAC